VHLSIICELGHTGPLHDLLPVQAGHVGVVHPKMLQGTLLGGGADVTKLAKCEAEPAGWSN